MFMGKSFITESILNLASSQVFFRRPPKGIASALYTAGTKTAATIFSEVESQGWRGRGLFSATKNNNRSSSDKTITAKMKKTQELQQ